MFEFVDFLNNYVSYIAQLFAIVVITVAMFKSIYLFFKDSVFKNESMASMAESRMEMGHAFSLALSFLIGASILKTTFAPTWNDIGKLAAIIGLRTILNYTLTKNLDKTIKKE